MQVRQLTAPLTLEGGTAPTEFKLLSAGINGSQIGDLLFDDQAAGSVMKRYQARKLDLMADYEHQSLVRPPIEAPASAKKWVPEVRDGHLIASQIAWTDRARSMLEAGEYRYFSIACKVDEKTNRVIELVNFALTNRPAANGIEPLMAASLSGIAEEENKETGMTKTIALALGLSADTEEAATINKAEKLRQLEADVLAITKTVSLSDAQGALRALAQSHEQVIALSAQVAQMATEKRTAEFDKLVKEGRDSVQITDAMADGEWIAALRGQEDGVTQLRSFLKTAPKLLQSRNEVKEAISENPTISLSAEEIDVARRFVGDDQVALEKRIEALKALKIQDSKRRAA